MINRSEIVFHDSRAQLRVRENKNVSWQTLDGLHKGRGRIKNISATGMLLETKSDFHPIDDSVLSFDADLGFENFIPRRGQLVWSRPEKARNNQYRCGIRFVEPTDFVNSKLRLRIQRAVAQFTKLKRLNFIAHGLTYLAMLAITGIIIWQSHVIKEDIVTSAALMGTVATQQSETISTLREQYIESQLQITALTDELTAARGSVQVLNKDLEATKAILLETERMLAEAKAKGSTLEGQVASVNTNVADLENLKASLQATITDLQERNVKLNVEMQEMNSQLNFLKGDAKTTAEAKQMISDFKQRIKSVKKKMRQFRREAKQTRMAANKEKDRLKLLLGNRGYFVRNGQQVKVDRKAYNSISADSKLLSEVTSSNAPSAKIDMTFVD